MPRNRELARLAVHALYIPALADQGTPSPESCDAYKFQGGRLKIDRLSIPGTWHYAGMLTSSIAIGAHLDSEIQSSQILYCPRCGKHQGIQISDFTLTSKPTAQDWILYRLAEKREATHGCKGCGHGWRELG